MKRISVTVMMGWFVCLGLIAASCGSDGESGSGEFPVSIETANGVVEIESQPERIVSLSPSATESLFAIGAGDQVVAVDLYSNFPAEAPEGSLDAFNIDLESILADEPDLVVAMVLPDDITTALNGLSIPVLIQPAATSVDDIYDQIGQLGIATGQIDGAAETNKKIREGIDQAIAAMPDLETPVRVYHDVGDSYTATSASFTGDVYSKLGFVNVADVVGLDNPFPLIEAETVITENPNLIVFTSFASFTADDIAARPGWENIEAVQTGNLLQVDDDIASRWGPRVVEFFDVLVAQVAGANA